MTESDRKEEDAFLEGFHDIPSAEQLSTMSFVKLADLMANGKPGTAKYIIVENALLKHQESAQKNNTSYGAKLGGIFSLVGVILGAVLSYLISNSEIPITVTCDVKSENVQTKNKNMPTISNKPEESSLSSKISEETGPGKSLQPTAKSGG